MVGVQWEFHRKLLISKVFREVNVLLVLMLVTLKARFHPIVGELLLLGTWMHDSLYYNQ